MQPRVLKLLEQVRSSYWFLPTVMAVAALVLGATTIYIDAVFGTGWLDGLSWYHRNSPDGAREVLSTIAGSAITVAGVVFSITIVSVSYAASQYGPRVLTNFMSDKGNQITLGTFIATFLYCLVVLRTIRGGDEGVFVPELSTIIALLLAICSIAVLIFFIHHVPRSIHVNTVSAGIGHQLIGALGERFPELIGDGPIASDAALEASLPAVFRHARALTPGAALSVVPAQKTGYIQTIDEDHLVALARRGKLIISLRCRTGDFIHAGRLFAEVWPPAQVDEQLHDDLQATYSVGSQRTPVQDTHFLLDELVEVGARALSSGVNDPFTAMTCLDWLGAALSEVARRKLSGPYRLDEGGVVRVIVLPMSFGDFVALSYGQFRQYLARDKIACLHAIRTLERIAAACTLHEQLAALVAEMDALRAAAGETLDSVTFKLVDEAARETGATLRALMNQCSAAQAAGRALA